MVSPIQEDALGLALIACSIGVLVCRAEISAQRRHGIYRAPATFEVNVRFWTRLGWVFGIGALLVASWWALINLAQTS